MASNTITSRSILFRAQFYLAFVLSLLLSGSALAQSEKAAARPDRGTMPNGSYSVSDIENISLQNGNVNLSIPLASLPAIAGGKLSWSINASYNSKLWNITRTEADAPDNQYHPYVIDNLQMSDLAGWHISGQYIMSLRDAHEDFDYQTEMPPDSMPYTEYNLRVNYNWYKLVIAMPDGSEHELRPIDYTPYVAGDEFLHGYYKENPYQNGTMRYYSFDGSYIYATMTNLQTWTVYMPDGTKIIQTPDGIQRIQDTNGNKIKIFSDTNGTHYQDEQTGREIRYSYDPLANNNKGQGVVTYQTVGGIEEHIYINFDYTIVQGQVYKVKDWIPYHLTGCNRNGEIDYQQIQVIREIVLPQTEPTEGQRRFSFSYNSDATETATTPFVRFTCSDSPQSYTRTASKGWGELSRIVTPSGAAIDYSYNLDAAHSLFLTNNLTEESITRKKLTHDNNTIDIWTYDIDLTGGTVTNPDGSTITETKYEHSPGMGYAFGKSGLVYRTTRPFSKVEQHWTNLAFSGASFDSPDGNVDFNPVVDYEYTTLLDGSNNALKMSAKAFQYDYNGNLVQTKDYDWFDPSLVSRDADGVPTGVPASATVLRVTSNSYYNAATSSTSGNVYAKRSITTGTPLILNAPQQATIGPSITQFSYDGQAYGTAPTVGNLTTLSEWDNIANSWISASTIYDAYGNVATSTDPRGKVTEIFYEDSTHALPTRVVVDPQNGTGAQTSTSTFDYYTGAVLSQTDPNQQVSTMDYTNQLLGTVDPFGRPGAVYSPAVIVNGTSQRHKTTTTYLDSQRQVIVTSDLNAEGDGLLKSRTTADQLGRPVLAEQSEDGSSNYTISSQTVYEQMGKITYQSNPHRSSGALTDGWTRSTKDVLGRVTEVATFSGATRPAYDTTCDAAHNCTGRVVSSYDANQTTVQDQAGKTRRSIVNAFGQLVRVDEPDASSNLGSVNAPVQPTSYTYDVLGNLTQVSQGSQTRTFSYSSLSRLTSANNPESGTISYQYDANGNLTQKVDARGVTTTYVYDALNRATSRSYSDSTPTVTYAYDASTITNGKGRLTSVSSNVSAYSYSGYDAVGKIIGSSQITNGQTYQMSYGYNLAGALTTETYPSGRIVTTFYDNAGRLSSLTGQKSGEANKTYASQLSYAASGAMTDLKLGNNLWEHSNFNSRLQPTEIGLGTAQDGIDRLKINYSYGTTDNNGNVQSQTITVPGGPTLSQSYTYDELNRLKVAQENSGTSWKQTFSYDKYGNRTFDTNNTTTNALGSLLTIDQANNRFTTGQGSILYDSAGNLTRDFSGHTFGYDGENRQTSYDGGATVGGGANYLYDGDGRRVRKVNGGGLETTIFVYDASGQMVAEYSSASQEPSSGTSYLTSDNLGTPRVITNTSGSVKARHDYLPFGEELAAGVGGRTTGQGYSQTDSICQKFTQKERDIETGLDYFGARYLSSTQGRFISVDPALTSANVATPQSWNRYAYSFNNPLRYIDPTGAWNWSATLGGSDSDADLLSNAGKDKKKIKAANKIIEQRNLFRNALADARATGPSSDEPDSVARAVNAYGSEGDGNGVTVTFGTTGNGIAAEAGASPNGALSFNANGSVTAQVLVTISSSVTNANELAQAVGHEGWHTADRQSFAAYLTRQFQAVGGAQNFGTADETRAYNSPYNRTVQTTELGAYIVSGLIAQGRDALGKNFPNSNFNGHEVWNNSWSAAERPGLRAVGAFEHVTTSPTYANRLTDRQFPH